MGARIGDAIPAFRSRMTGARLEESCEMGGAESMSTRRRSAWMTLGAMIAHGIIGQGPQGRDASTATVPTLMM
jgi:hypothetical protein